MMDNYVIKGHICYSKTSTDLSITENGFAVCENGNCTGVYEKLPESYNPLPCYDYTDKLIIPGLTDLHVHAPQYPFRGLGMDLELIEWLNTHTFIEEAKYDDLEYAKKAYEIFTEDLLHSATTRACVFGTIHTKATILLMEKLENAGMKAYVGKVNMDRNSPGYLCEESAKKSVSDTEKWIKDTKHLKNIKPILTPRFIPSCSDELMEQLALLRRKYRLPVQSHLSENLSEVQWVQNLCPDTRFYGEAYDKYGLFGNECPTIMAHCVHSSKEETDLMKKQNVFIAHCPESNTNLLSGIAPVRTYLDLDMKIGLGSDIAAGSSLSIFRAMTMAIQCSKLRWRLTDQSLTPLNLEEAFYLATKGGGEFFGKAGSFETGYEFDAVVLDDSSIRHPQKLSVRERLERLICLAEDKNIAAKFVNGRKLF
ncbi:MAG: amidohydrolase family protein [Dorea sp.]|jgi:guanine deaminase|nr:amidohydrolase family protein [Dorea sp.]